MLLVSAVFGWLLFTSFSLIMSRYRIRHVSIMQIRRHHGWNTNICCRSQFSFVSVPEASVPLVIGLPCAAEKKERIHINIFQFYWDIHHLKPESSFKISHNIKYSRWNISDLSQHETQASKIEICWRIQFLFWSDFKVCWKVSVCVNMF